MRRQLLAGTVSFLVLAACKKDVQPYELAIPAKDKIAIVRLPASDANLADTLVGITCTLLDRVNDTLDAQRPDSDIARINSIGNNARIMIGHDTFRLLDLAQYYSELSGGAYDFTIAPAAYLWGFEGGAVPTNVPSSELIQAAMLGTGANKLSLFDNGAAALTGVQTKISIFSLSSAYAADMAVVEAREKTIQNALILIDNDARALGVSDGGAPWEIPFVNPFATNETAGRLNLGTGIALSRADLRAQTVTIGGQTYGHIMDPRTGNPAQGTLCAVVSGPTATKCAVLAQALVVLGVEGAQKIMPKFTRCEAMIVPDRKPLEIWMTPGFAPRVKLNPELQQSVHYFVSETAAAPVKDAGAAGATNAAPASTPQAAK